MRIPICVSILCLSVLTGQVNVPFERIRDANKEPGNWLTYSRDYSGQRYSPLDQVNTSNVSRLHIAWMTQANEADTFETSPIVVDGTLFITKPPNVVEALDAVTGLGGVAVAELQDRQHGMRGRIRGGSRPACLRRRQRVRPSRRAGQQRRPDA